MIVDNKSIKCFGTVPKRSWLFAHENNAVGSAVSQPVEVQVARAVVVQLDRVSEHQLVQTEEPANVSEPLSDRVTQQVLAPRSESHFSCFFLLSDHWEGVVSDGAEHRDHWALDEVSVLLRLSVSKLVLVRDLHVEHVQVMVLMRLAFSLVRNEIFVDDHVCVM